MPYTFKVQGDRPNMMTGSAADMDSALEGAWSLSRHHDELVDVFEEGIKVAEVGVRWVDQD